MGSVFADVFRSHPRFLVGVVDRVPVKLYVAGDDESIHVVSCYGQLDLGGGLGRLVDQYGHLLSVCNGLTTLSCPYEQSFVRVDVAGDFSEC